MAKGCTRWQLAAARVAREVLRSSNAKRARVDTPPPISKRTRLATGCAIDNLGSLASAPPRSAPASSYVLATHTICFLPPARLKDLSKAFV